MINKRYFARFFKESLIFLGIITLVYLIFIFALSYSSNFKLNLASNSPIVSFNVLLLIYLLISPLYILHYKSSRNKADTYFSLPITKRSLLNTRSLVVLIDILIAYTFSFIIGILIAYSREGFKDSTNIALIFPYYLLSIIFALPSFFISLFVANKGNNGVDRILYITFYIYDISLAFNALNNFLLNYFADNPFIKNAELGNFFSSIAPILYLNNSIGYALNANCEKENIWTGASGISYLPTIIISILSLVALFFLERDENKEKSERISYSSTTIFGYKLIIPLVPFIVIGVIASLTNMPISLGIDLLYIELIIIILFLLLYFAYKRKFIVKMDMLYLAIPTVITNILVLLMFRGA